MASTLIISAQNGHFRCPSVIRRCSMPTHVGFHQQGVRQGDDPDAEAVEKPEPRIAPLRACDQRDREAEEPEQEEEREGREE